MRIAIVAPGAMGAGIGARLVEHGAEVLTALEGRGAESRERAARAGMRDASPQEIAGAAIVLSIVPPGQAVAMAERLAPALAAAGEKPVYVDCNAISPQTAGRVAAIVGGTGAGFLDGGIIGLPPKPGGRGPVLYLSGDAPGRAASSLEALGLACKVLDQPVGAASALKMSYAGITKGLTALGAAMMLAATRAGADAALRAELAESQPELLARLARSMPDMFGKAYRWVAEMEEIADFAADPDVAAIYRGMAGLYARLAEDHEGEGAQTGALAAFVAGAR